MLAHIPAGAPIVVEPVAPDAWGTRWNKYPSLLARISPTGALEPSVDREGRHRGLRAHARPGADRLLPSARLLLGRERLDRVRARATPTREEVPLAIAYYRALARARRSRLPRLPLRAAGRAPVAFDFDWSFDYYPLAYDRPGPEMTIYRLHGGRCARG